MILRLAYTIKIFPNYSLLSHLCQIDLNPLTWNDEESVLPLCKFYWA
jgi:hypothetical protein